LEDLGTDVTIILKYILKDGIGGRGLDGCGSETGDQIADCCAHGNEQPAWTP
jgi:hypothetical protein